MLMATKQQNSPSEEELILKRLPDWRSGPWSLESGAAAGLEDGRTGSGRAGESELEEAHRKGQEGREEGGRRLEDRRIGGQRAAGGALCFGWWLAPLLTPSLFGLTLLGLKAKFPAVQPNRLWIS